MFIGFGKFFHSTLKIEQKIQFLIVNVENVHTILMNFSTPHSTLTDFDTAFHPIRLLDTLE